MPQPYELSIQPRTVEFVSCRSESTGSPNKDESNDYDSEEEPPTPFNLSSPRTTTRAREPGTFPKESKSAQENRLLPQPSPSRTPQSTQQHMYIEESLSEDEDDPEYQVGCSTSPQIERNPSTGKAPKKTEAEEDEKDEPNAVSAESKTFI